MAALGEGTHKQPVEGAVHGQDHDEIDDDADDQEGQALHAHRKGALAPLEILIELAHTTEQQNLSNESVVQLSCMQISRHEWAGISRAY